MKDLMNSTDTMTSKEILELLNANRVKPMLIGDLHRDIKRLFAKEIEDGIIPSTLRPNGQVLEYHLPEVESKMLVATKDSAYLRQITEYWVNRSKPKELTTLELCDMLRATELARLAEVKKFENLNAEFLNVMETEGFYQFITVAKLLGKPGLGRTTLMANLRDSGILLKSNLPAQSQIDNGRFVVKRYYLDEVERHCTTTLVTEKGFIFLAQHFMNFDRDMPAIAPPPTSTSTND